MTRNIIDDLPGGVVVTTCLPQLKLAQVGGRFAHMGQKRLACTCIQWQVQCLTQVTEPLNESMGLEADGILRQALPIKPALSIFEHHRNFENTTGQ